MITRVGCLFYIGFLGFSLGRAQNAQNPFFFAESLHPQILNPAMVGLDKTNHFFAAGRFAWLGFEEAPSSQFLGVDTKLGERAIGFGAFLKFDQAGLLRQTQGNVSASVHILNTPTTQFSLGFSAGFLGLQVDEPNVPDPLVNSSDISGSTVNIGAGLAFARRFNNNRSSFRLGLALPQFGSTLDLVEEDSLLAYDQEASVVVQANITHEVNDRLTISPYLQLQTYSGKATVDLGMMARIRGTFNLGLGFRTGRTALYGVIGIAINNKASLTLAYEPFGPFGQSVDATVDVPFGERVLPSPGERPTRTRPDRDSAPVATSFGQEDWQRTDYWTQKLSDMGLSSRIRPRMVNTPSFDQSELYFEYDDNRVAYDISNTPYERILLGEISSLLSTSETNLSIDSVAFSFTTPKNLEESSEASYYEGPRTLAYTVQRLPSGNFAEQSEELEENATLSMGSLGALKIESLSRAFAERLGLTQVPTQYVVRNQQLAADTPPSIRMYLRLVKE